MSEHKEIKPHAEFGIMEQARATPVRPAIWMTGVLVWATVIALFLRVPTWAGIFLCSLTGISFLLYLVSYSYLMLHDRDSLRREQLRVKGKQVTEGNSIASVNVGLIGEQTQPTVMETSPIGIEQAVVRRDSA